MTTAITASLTPSPLTPRETQVYERIKLGWPNKQIANDLGISIKMVEFLASSLYKKLGVRNRTEAAIHNN